MIGHPAYAVIDTKRMCVIWIHDNFELLKDLGYIELSSMDQTTIIGLDSIKALEDFDDVQITKLGISLGLPIRRIAEAENSRKLVLQTMRKLEPTQARSIEAALQADWIREYTVNPSDRFQYIYDDILPAYAPIDYMPPALCFTNRSGKRAFKSSIRYKIFSYLNKEYERLKRPKDAHTLRLLCRTATAFMKEEFGYKATTTAQTVSSWKKELIENDYKPIRYDKGETARKVKRVGDRVE